MSLASKPAAPIVREMKFLDVTTLQDAEEIYGILADGRYVVFAVDAEVDKETLESKLLIVASPYSEKMEHVLMFRISVALAKQVELMTKETNRLVSFLSSHQRLRMNTEQTNRLKQIMSGFKEPINVSEVGGLIGVLHDPVPAVVNEAVSASEAIRVDANT